VLGKVTRPTVAGRDQDKYDEKGREAVMLIKLSVINEMLLEVPIGKLPQRSGNILKICMRHRTRAEPSF
jgi:hypothetical protein